MAKVDNEQAPDVDAVVAFMRDLQNRICEALLQHEGQANFEPDVWTREAGGRGDTRVLADGDISAKVKIAAAGISKAALAKLEKAGGSFTAEDLSSKKATEEAAAKAAKSAAKKQK